MKPLLHLLPLLAMLGADAAHAQSCNVLAERYARKSQDLSDSDLGALRTCVTNTLKARQGFLPSAPPAASMRSDTPSLLNLPGEGKPTAPPAPPPAFKKKSEALDTVAPPPKPAPMPVPAR